MKAYENIPFHGRPITANLTLSVCDPHICPVIHKIVTILLTTLLVLIFAVT